MNDATLNKFFGPEWLVGPWAAGYEYGLIAPASDKRPELYNPHHDSRLDYQEWANGLGLALEERRAKATNYLQNVNSKRRPNA